MKRIEADVATAAADLTTLDGEVQRLEAEDVAERPLVEARLVDLDKLGQGGYLRLLMSTSELRQVAEAARLVAEIERRDRERILAHQQRLATLRTSRTALAARSTSLALRTEAARAQAAAQRAVAGRNALLADIDRRRDLNAQRPASFKRRSSASRPRCASRPLEPRQRWNPCHSRPSAASSTGLLPEPRPASARLRQRSTASRLPAARAHRFSPFTRALSLLPGHSPVSATWSSWTTVARTLSVYGDLLERGERRRPRHAGQPIGTVGQSPWAPEPLLRAAAHRRWASVGRSR